MMTQTVTLELPTALYDAARTIARATKRPLSEVVRESLSNTLPPLDDVDDKEAKTLAAMSSCSDEQLWEIANAQLSTGQQTEITQLLSTQSAETLSADQQSNLDALLDQYGKILVRKSHAWLLLARRGYSVPVQQ